MEPVVEGGADGEGEVGVQAVEGNDVGPECAEQHGYVDSLNLEGFKLGYIVEFGGPGLGEPVGYRLMPTGEDLSPEVSCRSRQGKSCPRLSTCW